MFPRSSCTGLAQLAHGFGSLKSKPENDPSTQTIPARISGLIGLASARALLLAHAAMPQSVEAKVYSQGIDDRQRIGEINITNLTSPTDLALIDAGPLVCSALPGADYTPCTTGVGANPLSYYSNSFAYDKVRNHFFFLDYLGNLRFWDFKPTTPVPVLAMKANIGLANPGPKTGFTANAANYDNAFWHFISNNTLTTNAPDSPPSPDQNKLVRCAISYSSSNIPVVSASNQATLSSVPNLPSATQTPLSPAGAALTPNGQSFTFGDIAIVEAGAARGTLYGTTAAGGFFTLDLNSCSPMAPAGPACDPATVLINKYDPDSNPSNTPSLQVFEDSGILEGQTHGDASGISNGHLVAPGGWGTSPPLRDIAGAFFRRNVVALREHPCAEGDLPGLHRQLRSGGSDPGSGSAAAGGSLSRLRALSLAAGLGTCLRPITRDTPKGLLPVGACPCGAAGCGSWRTQAARRC